jgi:hypothetical protein
MSRITPFEQVFGTFRDRFQRLREEMTATGKDPRDRDGFLLEREVAGMLQELRPEAGFGEATESVAALVHHAYLFWEAGERVNEVTRDELVQVVQESPDSQRRATEASSTYVQLPPLAIWALLEDGSVEPLDGWFQTTRGGELQVLAVLGLRPGRPGFTTLSARGPAPGFQRRDDGSARFAPLETKAGARAGIGAVTSEAELLELCWRIGAGAPE